MARQERAPGWSRYLLLALISILALMAGVTWLAFAILRPTPPRRVAMATGPEGGRNAALGMQYREILARDGIDLRLVPSAGVVENAALLRDPNSGVSVAIIPGGITNEKESPGLISLGTLFYDPLWVFYRPKSKEFRGNLRDMRISIGPEGSGAHMLALEFFTRVGIIDQVSDTLLSLPPSEACEKLLSGEIDGVVLLGGWESSQVQKLLAARKPEATKYSPGRSLGGPPSVFKQNNSTCWGGQYGGKHSGGRCGAARTQGKPGGPP